MENLEPAAAKTSERGQLLRAIVASTVGTTIEWYDFFLYNTAAALVFAKLFFPKEDPVAGTLSAFAIQFVGFAARPLGAFIFGHFGDRVGRKATLIVTLLTMGLASALIGLLPTYAQIGLLGAVLLTVLRLLQGIAVGGEWGGSVVLSMEWGHRGRRGWIASWPQWGVPAGLVLGNGILLLLSSTLSESAFLSWGWRVPFLLSLVLVAVGLYIRLGILETPLFSRILQERRLERAPSLQVIARQPREVILSALIRMSEQAPFYIFTAFVLVYAVAALHVTRTFALNAVLLAAVLSLVSIPFFGYLSDVIGRRRMYLIGVVATALFAFPYFWMLNSKAGLIITLAIILSLIPHDMQYGPQAAFIAENFTGRMRYSGASIGYQLASIVAGGPAPLIATWLLAGAPWPPGSHVLLLPQYKGSYVPIAIYMVACALISLVATVLIPDRSKVDLSEEFDSAQPPEHTREARRISPAG
ncbi:MAG: MHS family MFS transporter [Chloroflexi bacterium]|nr:MAG: MHS family MFS transporter [Chloroflexota bacterium]